MPASKTPDALLQRVLRAPVAKLLSGGLKGLEKESLRVTPQGRMAQTPHSKALGAALTHPHITTDYSEALIELVTLPLTTPDATLGFLADIHSFVYQHLHEEMLWGTSMPCRLGTETEIPIANYGRSNIGMMKHVYR
ncbi:MAG: glutamate--cysteine ligase, partial [Gammaproteobacteria bacterium]|nr:glutamate--cysteine ligase [Gammaproteobacteria bacterium]